MKTLLGKSVLAATIGSLVLIAGCSSAADSSDPSAGGAGTTPPSATDGGSGAGGSAGGAGAGDPIIIGHAAGTTGFMAVFDIPVARGMELAVDEINAAGGVLGRPLKIVSTDNGSDVAKIQPGAEDALAQGAELLVTSCDYDMGGPAARTANDKGVIAFSCAGSPNFGLTGIGPLSYNITPGSVSEGVTLAEWAKEKGYSKPYLLTDTGLEYSQVIGDTFDARWSALGGSLAGKDTFGNADASVEAQVGGIRDSGADVIVVASYPPGGAKMLAEIRTQGIDTPILGSQAFDGTYWLETVPNLSDFTIPAAGSLYGDDPVAQRNEFFKRFSQTFGEPAASSNYPLSGYSAVQAYSDAVTAAGSTDSAAVQKALDDFAQQDTLIGATTYTDTCHIPAGREYLMLTYTDGKPAVTGKHTPQEFPGGAPC